MSIINYLVKHKRYLFLDPFNTDSHHHLNKRFLEIQNINAITV